MIRSRDSAAPALEHLPAPNLLDAPGSRPAGAIARHNKKRPVECRTMNSDEAVRAFVNRQSETCNGLRRPLVVPDRPFRKKGQSDERSISLCGFAHDEQH